MINQYGRWFLLGMVLSIGFEVYAQPGDYMHYVEATFELPACKKANQMWVLKRYRFAPDGYGYLSGDDTLSDKNKYTLKDTFYYSELPRYQLIRGCGNTTDTLFINFEQGSYGTFQEGHTFQLGQVAFEPSTYDLLPSMFCDDGYRKEKLCIPSWKLAERTITDEGLILFADYQNQNWLHPTATGQLHPVDGKTGDWFYRLPDGSLYMTDHYEHGKLHGNRTIYYQRKGNAQEMKKLKHPITMRFDNGVLVEGDKAVEWLAFDYPYIHRFLTLLPYNHHLGFKDEMPDMPLYPIREFENTLLINQAWVSADKSAYKLELQYVTLACYDTTDKNAYLYWQTDYYGELSDVPVPEGKKIITRYKGDTLWVFPFFVSNEERNGLQHPQREMTATQYNAIDYKCANPLCYCNNGGGVMFPARTIYPNVPAYTYPKDTITICEPFTLMGALEKTSNSQQIYFQVDSLRFQPIHTAFIDTLMLERVYLIPVSGYGSGWRVVLPKYDKPKTYSTETKFLYQGITAPKFTGISSKTKGVKVSLSDPQLKTNTYVDITVTFEPDQLTHTEYNRAVFEITLEFDNGMTYPLTLQVDFKD